MNKDKHVLPDDDDTFTDRIRREARSRGKRQTSRVIYGPDNELLSEVEVKKGK